MIATRPGIEPEPAELVHQLGGAIAHAGVGETAFGQRRARFLLNVIARSFDAATFERDVTWANATCDAIDPAGSARSYASFTSDLRRADFHPPDAQARLAGVATRYDPDNVFRRLGTTEPPVGIDTGRVDLARP
jgi:hypothetical protein